MDNNGSYQVVGGDVFYGSTPKYKLDIQADLPMSDFDFDLKLTCGEKSLIVRKNDLLLTKDGDYLLCLDTKLLGAGVVRGVVTAYIPDSDFPDGIRREIGIIDKPIVIKRV